MISAWAAETRTADITALKRSFELVCIGMVWSCCLFECIFSGTAACHAVTIRKRGLALTLSDGRSVIGEDSRLPSLTNVWFWLRLRMFARETRRRAQKGDSFRVLRVFCGRRLEPFCEGDYA